MSDISPLNVYFGIQEAATAAFVFPEQWNAPVCDYLSEILSLSGATLSPEHIEQRIREEPGTILEPMVLQETDYRLLGLLGALAFSKVAEPTRFRVISRDTMGDGGGLIFLPGGSSYFSPRFGTGKRASQKKFSGGLVAPALVATLSQRVSPAATACFNETAGLQITVEWRRNFALPSGIYIKKQTLAHDFESSKLMQKLQQNSGVANSQRDTFDRLGFRLDHGWNVTRQSIDITLTAGSSEAVMRLVALCSQNAILKFALQEMNGASGDPHSDITTLYVRLALPNEESENLEVIPIYQSANRSYSIRLPGLQHGLISQTFTRTWPKITQRLPGLDLSQFNLTIPPYLEKNAPTLLEMKARNRVGNKDKS